MKERIYWWLLKKSGVFKYCYTLELRDLLYKLERFDFDGKETIKFYQDKYQRIKSS